MKFLVTPHLLHVYMNGIYKYEYGSNDNFHE